MEMKDIAGRLVKIGKTSITVKAEELGIQVIECELL